MKRVIKIIQSIFLVFWAFASINILIDNNVLKHEVKSLKSSNSWKTKRLKNYVEITIIQDNIIVNYNQTRKAKSENKELLKLTQNLY